jgi:uncharacterized membrane protein YccC
VPDLLSRLADSLADDLRALSRPGPRDRAALRTALAGTAAALIALALHIDDPWWAAITGVAIVQSDAAATVSRSIDRVIGTLVGALVGYLAAATIADHVLFLAIAAGCTGFSIYGQERVAHGYALLLGGATVLLVMLGSLAAPEEALSIAVYRGFAIVIGVVVACVVDYALAKPGAPTQAAGSKPGIRARPIDRDLAAIAITGGIAIGLIPLIWETLNLPGLGQTPITAFVILTAMRQEPVWKALTRAAGCLFGGVYGLVAMHLVGGVFLPWLAAMFAGLYVASHVRHGNGDASYVGQQAAVAIVLAMIQGSGPLPDILPVIDRLIGIFGGLLVVALCQPLFGPLVRGLLELRD